MRWPSAWDAAAVRHRPYQPPSTWLRASTLHLEKGVGQRDGVHFGGQPRLDHEHHRHLSRLVRLQLLACEAEALELLEIAPRHLRTVARNGLAKYAAIGRVFDFIDHLHELARMHLHRFGERPEAPRQLVAQVGVKL